MCCTDPVAGIVVCVTYAPAKAEEYENVVLWAAGSVTEYGMPVS
jgi:hypothetical protein